MGTVLATTLEFRSTADKDELRKANELMAGAHADDSPGALRWLVRHASSYPGLPRGHTRIALLNGEIAGALRLTTETMRLGEARLRVGGLGWVATAPQHRHRGICTGLLQETRRYMIEQRYHLSMLFGIPNFYHRFGFATTLADYLITLDAAEAPTVLSGEYKIRPVKPGDIGAIQKMHSANDEGVACSLLRSSAHLKMKWDRFSSARVFTTHQGRVVAYVLLGEDEKLLPVQEVGIDDRAAAPDVLAYCTQRAQDDYKPRVRFMTPPEHVFARFLAGYESTHEMRLSRQRGGMMSFMDIGESLESMLPEWEGRAAQSIVADRRCEVTLLVDGVGYRLRSHYGAIDIAAGMGKNKFSITSTDLMRLLTGYTHLEDIYNLERRLIASDARAFLAAIFPKRNPYVHTFDRF